MGIFWQDVRYAIRTTLKRPKFAGIAGLLITLTGIGLGLAAALGLTRLMPSLLFEVAPIEPVTFTLVPAFLVAVALLAAWLPARRATRVDPAIVLKEE